MTDAPPVYFHPAALAAVPHAAARRRAQEAQGRKLQQRIKDIYEPPPLETGTVSALLEAALYRTATGDRS